MEIGEQVGKYVVEAELGRGGMGVVYRARHATLERTVALKVLSPKLAPDSSARGRFVREAQAIARLNHPGIVQIFDIEEQEELLYLVMEFVEGDNLDGLLKKTSISFRRAARIVADLAAALHFAHEKGVVHRDVKPANILLTPHRTVKLADFGLAHLLDREMGLTKTGMVVGSPHYMSPEQCQGNPVDRRADVYALGIVLYRMLVGSVPFSAPNSLSVLVSQVQEPTPDPLAKNPQVPLPLRDVIVRAMEKNPDARFQTMREMQRALLAWLGEPLPDDREEFLKQKGGDVPTVLLPGVPPGASSGPGARAATATEAIPPGALPTALSTPPPTAASHARPSSALAPPEEVETLSSPTPFPSVTGAASPGSGADERGPSRPRARRHREAEPVPVVVRTSRSGWIPGIVVGILIAAAVWAWQSGMIRIGPPRGSEAPVATAAVPPPSTVPQAGAPVTPPPEATAGPVVPTPGDEAAAATPGAGATPGPATPAVPSPAPAPTAVPAPSPTAGPRELTVPLPASDPRRKAGAVCVVERGLNFQWLEGDERSQTFRRKVWLDFGLDPAAPKAGEPFFVVVWLRNDAGEAVVVERVVPEPADEAAHPKAVPGVTLPLTVPPRSTRPLVMFEVSRLPESGVVRGVRAFAAGNLSWGRSAEIQPCR